jgi:hypothetical protein
MLPSDSTEIEPPQLFPVIDMTTNPATHWFVRSPYVDPDGIGSGPWSIEDDTWKVYGGVYESVTPVVITPTMKFWTD